MEFEHDPLDDDPIAPEVRAEQAAGIDDPASPHYAGHRPGDPRCGLGLGGPCTCDSYPATPDPLGNGDEFIL